VLHGADSLATGGSRHEGLTVPDELGTRLRVLALGVPRELEGADRARQVPLGGQATVRGAPHLTPGL
jgi:hypothetical protein